jgi:hypothetical protein
MKSRLKQAIRYTGLDSELKANAIIRLNAERYVYIVFLLSQCRPRLASADGDPRRADGDAHLLLKCEQDRAVAAIQKHVAQECPE